MTEQQSAAHSGPADAGRQTSGTTPPRQAQGPHHPELPDTFDGTLYPPVTHDEPGSYIVMEFTVTADDNFTASITAGSPFLKVFSIEVDDVQWDLEDTAGEVPGRPKLVWVPDFIEKGKSDGVQPLAVKMGQYVILTVELNVPLGSLPPGNVSGTVVLQGAAFSKTLALQGTYLGVDLNSPIGRKWQDMGGDQTLGLVYGNAQPAPDGKGIVQQFANGWLYQTPSAQVFFMSNAVYAKWLSLSSATDAFGNPLWGVLGFPTEDTFATTEGGQALRFQGGAIVVRANFQAYVVYGAIYIRYAEVGNLSDPNNQPFLGLPISDERSTDPPSGFRVSNFDFGDIYWSSATGAHEIYGAIRQEWLNVGIGNLGYPITDETGTPDGIGHFNGFQNGAIYWTPSTGAHSVRGPILSRWNALGSERSYLGYPIAEQAAWVNPTNSNPGVVASFQYGQIGWTSQDGVLEMPDSKPMSAQVSTPSGTALGGWVNLTLWSNGNFTFQFHMHDSGAVGYNFDVRAIVTAPDLTNQGPYQGGVCFVAAHSGSVGGTFTSGSRDDDYTESGNHPYIQAQWSSIKNNGFLWVTKDYSATGVLGMFEDVVASLLNVAQNAAGGAVGIVLALGSEAGQLFGNLGIGGPFGLIAGVIVFAAVTVAGGYGLALAVVTGVVVGAVINNMVQQRPILPNEYNWANTNVFGNTLPPIDQLVITNFSTLDNRPFTMPGIDGKIYVNMADSFTPADSPNDMTTVVRGKTYPSPGEILIHELTHAWQIYHSPSLPWSPVVCQGIVNGTNYALGQDPYQYGPPNVAWGDFNLEAQGAIVDQWFGGVPTVNAPNRVRGDEIVSDDLHTKDPYFHYIRDNIRAGRT